MDFDLEIISEEGDRPDPLFDSIMNAMNSMKEATADKIYQKIQKEGSTNYSKPQVDRALASALKYGIFEVRNNRYRVRDDVLDDEDTVYWKCQKKRDQTPFRIQDDSNEKQNGPHINPEKDNRRFRKPGDKDEACPHCGRNKRPIHNSGEVDRRKKRVTTKASQRKPTKENQKHFSDDENKSKRKRDIKRKDLWDKNNEKSIKRRKIYAVNEAKIMDEGIYSRGEKFLGDIQNEIIESQEGTSNSSDSDMEVLSISESALKCYEDKSKSESNKRKRAPRSAFSSECIKTDLEVLKSRRSSISVKTESESEKTYMSSASDVSHAKTADGFFEHPCTSRNATGKVRNQYLHSGDMYRNQYERSQTEQSKGNPDWLGCSDEPQGAIIQSNNVLTIEPMDSLAFKNPEQASYIS